MIIYNVTVSVDPEVHDEWLRWMVAEHLPEVLATGFFLEHRFCRVLTPDENEYSYAVQYTCADMDAYERYRSQHAPRLQARTAQRFGERCQAFRTLLRVLPTA
jgi:Domain of unknown function (DUF4286)